MKRATQTLFGSVLLVLVSGGAMILAACASDSTSSIPGDGTGSNTSQTEPAATSSGTSNSNSGGSGSGNSGNSGGGSGSTKTCVSKCTQDTDCANSCPVISGAISCCDQNTNVCYSTKQSMCPAPQQTDDGGAGGGGTPAY